MQWHWHRHIAQLLYKQKQHKKQHHLSIKEATTSPTSHPLLELAYDTTHFLFKITSSGIWFPLRIFLAHLLECNSFRQSYSEFQALTVRKGLHPFTTEPWSTFQSHTGTVPSPHTHQEHMSKSVRLCVDNETGACLTGTISSWGVKKRKEKGNQRGSPLMQ